MSETELVQRPAVVEVAEYEPLAMALEDLRARYGGAVYDCAVAADDMLARQARRELVKTRTALEAKRKELKGPALERSRLIDSVAKQIEGEILALEGPIDSQIKAQEERVAAEKKAKAEAEQARVDAINARIQAIRNFADKAPAKVSSDQLKVAIDRLNLVPIDDSYSTFREYAEQVKCETLQRLEELRNAAVAREEEAARLKAEREELDRKKAEMEAFLAEQRAEQVREQREQQERFEAKRAEQERIDREANEKRLADRLAEEEARTAAYKAEREKIDAERKALEEERRKDAARRDEEDRIALAKHAEEMAKIEAENAAEKEADERIRDAADDYYHAVEDMIRAEMDGGIAGEAFAEEWGLLKEIHRKAKGEAE